MNADLRQRFRDALAAYNDATARYAERTAKVTARLARQRPDADRYVVDKELELDYQRNQAGRDAAWARDEAVMLGIALLVEGERP